MTDRHDDLKRILAEGMEREAGLTNTLRQVMDRYPDATAAEIADAMRPVNEEAADGRAALMSCATVAHRDDGQRR